MIFIEQEIDGKWQEIAVLPLFTKAEEEKLIKKKIDSIANELSQKAIDDDIMIRSLDPLIDKVVITKRKFGDIRFKSTTSTNMYFK